MYSFNFHIVNIDDLKGDDPMLCLGFFNLIAHEVKIEFFSNRFCMCFFTLQDLIYNIYLEYQIHKFKYCWVGDDNGAIVNLLRKENKG